MARAQFEEKEFETQINNELADGRFGKVWSAGQVLEGVVAYDGITDPDVEHVVWSVLRVPRPKGVILRPSHWSGGIRPSAHDLASNPVTLILQYKRPEYLQGARAKQWKLWYKPYFRFERVTHQHSILRRLEKNLGDRALVRYAAPAFWTRADFEASASKGFITKETGFVSPSVLGTHKVWTYVSPGIDGRGNPAGREAPFESSDQLHAELSRPRNTDNALVLSENALNELSIKLGSIAAYRQPRLRRDIGAFGTALLNAQLGLSDQAVRSIMGIAAMTTLMAEIGASWHLVSPKA